jgi:dihydrofolate reductase
MKIMSIAAVAENGVIGKDNDLIWNLPDDMKFFKKTTLNKTVIMGRRNFESIPEKFRPLPKRVNIVLTRNEDYSAAGAHVFHSIEKALDFCKSENHDEVFIIGGGEIYKLAHEKNLIDEIYLTRVHATFEGDSFYPELHVNEWNKEVVSEHGVDDRHDYPFTIEHWKKK